MKTGRPDVELARVASDEQADLLVVGSRGRGEIGFALLGSVSQSLERLSPCPVLVVPTGCHALKGEQPEKDETVICGIADPESQEGLVEFSAGLAGAVRARLDVVHANPLDGRNGTLLTPASADFWLSGGAPDDDRRLLPLERRCTWRRLKACERMPGSRRDRRPSPYSVLPSASAGG